MATTGPGNGARLTSAHNIPYDVCVSREQQSLLQGEALVQHVDMLEQMLAYRLKTLRELPLSPTGSPSAEEHVLCVQLGLIADELRRITSRIDGVPF